MADYISREAAVDAFFPVDPENDGSDGTTTICLELNYSNNEIESILWEVPAADVEPVRRGRWEGYTHSCYCGIDQCGDPIFREKTVYYCSNPKCRRKTVVKENFCPSCGAKMDLEEENNEK